MVVTQLSGEPKIKCKLLLSSHSTPWKEVVTEYHYSRREQLVALKILTADISKDNTELSMLLPLSRSTLKHPMADSSIFIITKFSSFTDILYQQPGKGKYDKPMQTPLPARAPEVINKSPLDASIDIWALG